MSSSLDNKAEWLEPDGLGGFASGTVSGIRTRRYHAVLLTALRPPTGRVVLVNGYDVWVDSPEGSFALSSQFYGPGVTYPDGVRRVESFARDPWPRWIFSLEDGTKVQQELFMLNGAAVTALSWRLVNPRSGITLSLRPFISGRDYHSSGLGHVSEIADADPPHTPRGCPSQAWSMGELLRIELSILA